MKTHHTQTTQTGNVTRFTCPDCGYVVEYDGSLRVISSGDPDARHSSGEWEAAARQVWNELLEDVEM